MLPFNRNTWQSAWFHLSFGVHQMVEKEKSVAEQSTVSLDSRGRHRSMAKIRPATALGCPKKNKKAQLLQ
jgi:hypothetical protein